MPLSASPDVRTDLPIKPRVKRRYTARTSRGACKSTKRVATATLDSFANDQASDRRVYPLRFTAQTLEQGYDLTKRESTQRIPDQWTKYEQERQKWQERLLRQSVTNTNTSVAAKDLCSSTDAGTERAYTLSSTVCRAPEVSTFTRTHTTKSSDGAEIITQVPMLRIQATQVQTPWTTLRWDVRVQDVIYDTFKDMHSHMFIPFIPDTVHGEERQEMVERIKADLDAGVKSARGMSGTVVSWYDTGYGDGRMSILTREEV